MDSISSRLQMIILWHDVRCSSMAIACLTIAFLGISYFKARFYATVMILLFCYNFLNYWFTHVWPVIRVPATEDEDCDRWTHLHPQLLTLTEIRQLVERCESELKRNFFRLLKYRQNQPFRFCVGICSFLLITAIIGIYVKGLVLLYLTSLSIMTLPALHSCVLPKSVKDFLNFSSQQQQSFPESSSTSTTLNLPLITTPKSSDAKLQSSPTSSTSSSVDADEYEIISEDDVPLLINTRTQQSDENDRNCDLATDSLTLNDAQ